MHRTQGLQYGVPSAFISHPLSPIKIKLLSTNLSFPWVGGVGHGAMEKELNMR